MFDATRDLRGPEGDLIAGPRKVRPGGKIKFNHSLFQSDQLLPYIGQYVYIDGADLSRITKPRVMVYEDYWCNRFICSIGENGDDRCQ